MATTEANQGQVHPEAAAFISQLIDTAARERLPDLFSGGHPDALYRVPDRNGVSVLVVRTPQLSEEHLVKLMKYRLAQYLAVNFVDTDMIYAARMEYEPLAGVSPQDVHLIAGSVETGEILCYAAIKAGTPAPGKTLRDRDRPLFPVEKVHGWGIYNRLRILPDLQVDKLREMGRFVKNQRLHTFDALGARGPIEVGVAIFRSLVGPLRLEVDAIIGDLEEGVAKQNLDFFHIPLVVLHGTVPYEPEASYFFPRYQFCTVYPFSILASDIDAAALARLDAVERALALPGKQALVALIALKKDIPEPRSTLEAPEGLAPLTNADLPQRGVSMATRRQLLDAGEQLRTTDLFHDLSVAEATILGTFMERREHQPDEVVVHQGEVGNELVLIESGTAEVRVASSSAQSTHVATLGPGDFFGEIALVTGGERSADVIATGPLAVRYLSADAYARFLADSPDVGRQVNRAAMSRLRDTTRRVSRGFEGGRPEARAGGVEAASAPEPEPEARLGGVDAGREPQREPEREPEVTNVPDLFRISAAEANVLGTFMERLEVPAGTVIVRQSEAGDALYLIASGSAEVRVTNTSGQSVLVATLGPGEYFGEVALVTHGERIADVVALTPMTLARLNRAGYDRFVAHTSAMQQQLATTAAMRAGATTRKLISGR
ncbi:MAG TPA: cyclic nucleotide-binding domain-containing protein [Chloroflexota bacterium]|nr:cyclic nucleotide-binding domain-containing protein [Chloroflexota bacterium]